MPPWMLTTALGAAKESPDSLRKIVEGVPVLGENNKFSPPTSASNIDSLLSRSLESSSHFLSEPLCRTCKAMIRDSSEFLSRPCFVDCSGGRGLINDLLFQSLYFFTGRLIQILDIIFSKGQRIRKSIAYRPPLLRSFFFAQTAFQAFSPTLE